MFSVGDKIVHPMHGAGVIEDLIVRKVDGSDMQYYALKLALNNMIIYIPTHTSENLGVRVILSEDDAMKVIEAIPSIEIDDNNIWNRRYRQNMLKIRSGDINELLTVVKNLSIRNSERGLSTGEKKMLSSAKNILVSELTLSLDKEYDEVCDMLDFGPQ